MNLTKVLDFANKYFENYKNDVKIDLYVSVACWDKHLNTLPPSKSVAYRNSNFTIFYCDAVAEGVSDSFFEDWTAVF